MRRPRFAFRTVLIAVGLIAVACMPTREPIGSLYLTACGFTAWAIAAWVVRLDEADKGRRSAVLRRTSLFVAVYVHTFVVSFLAYGLVIGVIQILIRHY